MNELIKQQSISRTAHPPLKMHHIIKMNFIQGHKPQKPLLSHKKDINLQNNPWECDCHNEWIFKKLVPWIHNVSLDLLKSKVGKKF